ncbi:MAG: nucleotidyltransferase [Cereibacter sphaeroides]|uniref:Nucleotidyltransferase n=1 Tax=Cereibacter sphaeroides TaxID=1063 RepID=A0A2W5SCL0_CERSP|nr:MAG: nucleotidyltransferase [Cereibacter sphaeroides]
MRPARPLMLFAAGFGKRMGALTTDRPKPLVEVAGVALIDHALSLAEAAGANPIVVNLHYRGEQLAQHLAERDVRLSWEREEILETGGGLRQAMAHLGKGPVATLNSDAVWTGENPVVQLEAGWNNTRMDALLLLAPVDRALGHGARADFSMAEDGRIARHSGGSEPGYVYLGAQIIRPDGLASIPERVFSLNLLWDRMIAAGRAFGLLHQGGWCDVGRPESIALAETLIRESGDV